jgi:hypothetical protein
MAFVGRNAILDAGDVSGVSDNIQLSVTNFFSFMKRVRQTLIFI